MQTLLSSYYIKTDQTHPHVHAHSSWRCMLGHTDGTGDNRAILYAGVMNNSKSMCSSRFLSWRNNVIRDKYHSCFLKRGRGVLISHTSFSLAGRRFKTASNRTLSKEIDCFQSLPGFFCVLCYRRLCSCTCLL